METLLVAALTGAGGVAGALLWLVRARPGVILAWWGVAETEVQEHGVVASALRALSAALATIVLLLGFLTGLALSSLGASTGG